MFPSAAGISQSEYQKRLEENQELANRLEDLKKENMKELDQLVHRLQEVTADNDKLTESKAK